MGVKGFPTLKIVKPGTKAGKPIVEDYNGPRTAKGIVDAVIDKIPNHVKRVDDKTLEAWLGEATDTAKAILFTDKGKTSALMKAIAIDFKGSINVAQIRNTDKEKASLELFGITKYPTLILLPGGKEAEGIVYDGEMKKEPMVKFLSQAAEPNQDPAPAKGKSSKPKKESKKASKDKESFKKASNSHASAEGSSSAASATAETLVTEPTESPSPEVETEKPVVLPEPAPPITILSSEFELIRECLGQRTGTCVLALLPSAPEEVAATIVGVLSEVSHKHSKQQRKTFPFYVVPESNAAYGELKKALSLGEKTEVIAINTRRGWWRSMPEGEVTEALIENWVGQIKLGEGAKNKLPAGLIPEEPEVEVTPEPAAEEPVPETVVEAKEEATTEPHDEL